VLVCALPGLLSLHCLFLPNRCFKIWVPRATNNLPVCLLRHGGRCLRGRVRHGRHHGLQRAARLVPAQPPQGAHHSPRIHERLEVHHQLHDHLLLPDGGELVVGGADGVLVPLRLPQVGTGGHRLTISVVPLCCLGRPGHHHCHRSNYTQGGRGYIDGYVLRGAVGRLEHALAGHHAPPHLHLRWDTLPPSRFVFPDQDPDGDEAGRRQDREAGEAHHAHRSVLCAVLCARVHHHRLPLLRAVLLLLLDGSVAGLYLQGP